MLLIKKKEERFSVLSLHDLILNTRYLDRTTFLVHADV